MRIFKISKLATILRCCDVRFENIHFMYRFGRTTCCTSVGLHQLMRFYTEMCILKPGVIFNNNKLYPSLSWEVCLFILFILTSEKKSGIKGSLDYFIRQFLWLQLEIETVRAVALLLIKNLVYWILIFVGHVSVISLVSSYAFAHVNWWLYSSFMNSSFYGKCSCCTDHQARFCFFCYTI